MTDMTPGGVVEAATPGSGGAGVRESGEGSKTPVPPLAASNAEKIAEQFHYTYELFAPGRGYRTRRSSSKPWRDIPEKNRALMVATVQDLLDRGVIAVGSEVDTW